MFELELKYRRQELDKWQSAFIEMQTFLSEGRGELKQLEATIGAEVAYLAREVAPEVTGHLKRAIVMAQEEEVTAVYISPEVVNPYSPEDPFQYGPKVHAMGGTNRKGQQRAFFTFVIDEHGDDLMDYASDEAVASLEVILP